MGRYRSVLLAILLSFGGLANAQGTPHNLRVVPNPAEAGQPIVARLFHLCDEAEHDAPTVSVLGNVVTLSQSFVPAICIGLPPPPPEVQYPLGVFAQGTYTLNYVLRERGSGATTQESSQFTIVAGVPRNLRVVPNPAVAGQPVAARLLQGCYEGAFAPTTVTVAGNVVTLTQVPAPGIICLATPPPPADVDYLLGTFVQGTYTLNYFFRDTQGNVLYQESTQFVVGAPAGVPAMTPRLLLLLAGVLGAFGLRQLMRSA